MIQAGIHGDFGPLATLRDVLRAPFDAREEFADHTAPPEAHEEGHPTFCGTRGPA